MNAQKCLAGVYRRAGEITKATFLSLNSDAVDFEIEVIKPLAQWRPDGILVRSVAPPQLTSLRQYFPTTPVVSTVMAPAHLTDSMVLADPMELLILAREHFHTRGLSHVALFSMAADFALHRAISAFRIAVPNGPEVICPREIACSRRPAMVRMTRKMMTEGLEGLPKPFGIVTLETGAAPFLLTCCLDLGLKVPEEAQIIGVDDVDRCMECYPWLTSLTLPNEIIGEVAMETLLGHLQHDQPRPDAIIPVCGAKLVPRQTTALLHADQQSIARLRSVMQTQGGDGISVSRLAKLTKIGRTSVYKQFSATGETPARHLRQLRLQKVCQLLRDTEGSVAAVAAECGFNDPVALTHFFRRQTGESPTGYRERIKKMQQNS